MPSVISADVKDGAFDSALDTGELVLVDVMVAASTNKDVSAGTVTDGYAWVVTIVDRAARNCAAVILARRSV